MTGSPYPSEVKFTNLTELEILSGHSGSEEPSRVGEQATTRSSASSRAAVARAGRMGGSTARPFTGGLWRLRFTMGVVSVLVAMMLACAAGQLNLLPTNYLKHVRPKPP
ncbi:uncharacterized protein LOC122245692, partial [Penaeus japonicus]|uniref:uncharacterized protein LOC122245692 n=1 Tax=Penaeus japonicus TaxID=27405 RepID=UPI001C714857